MVKNTKKDGFLATKLGFITLNLVLAIALGTLLLIALVSWLRKYTDHDVEVEIPQITGLYPEEAAVLLQSAQLELEIADSTFSHKVPLGTIVEQIPQADSHAKRGRKVYAIVNAKTRQKSAIPALHDMSYRQAENNLRRLGFVVDTVIYQPSEFRDLVIDILYNDEPVEPGTYLEEGSLLTLVVGTGKRSQMIAVPDLRGRNAKEARRMLLEHRFTMGSCNYDEQPTEETEDQFVVYDQDPAAGKLYLEGSSISIRLSTDLEKTITEGNTDDEEEFF